MKETRYVLPISIDYVANWGVFEAVRELLQNAIDSNSELEVDFEGDTLNITSEGVRLAPRTLLLGVTSKKDDDTKIGQFGEGFKLALLVLTRMGRNVIIYNGDAVWVPSIVYSEVFEEQVLVVDEIPYSEEFGKRGLTFEVNYLTEEDIDTIKKKCLMFSDTEYERIHTKYGDILPGMPGELYVSGLYVCSTDLKYGYDLIPSKIQLDRDRKTVNGWDLKYSLKDLWFECGNDNLVASLLEQDIPDVEHVKYSTPERIRDACYKLFRSKYPDKVIAGSQQELDNMIRQGMTNVVVLHQSSYKDIVSSHIDYDNYRRSIPESDTPTQQLEKSYGECKKYLNRIAKDKFKALILSSKKWKVI